MCCPVCSGVSAADTDDNAFLIHEEVNTVKHDASGLLNRKATPEAYEVIGIGWSATMRAAREGDAIGRLGR
jgi:hypothetical protein